MLISVCFVYPATGQALKGVKLRKTRGHPEQN